MRRCEAEKRVDAHTVSKSSAVVVARSQQLGWGGWAWGRYVGEVLRKVQAVGETSQGGQVGDGFAASRKAVKGISKRIESHPSHQAVSLGSNRAQSTPGMSFEISMPSLSFRAIFHAGSQSTF